MSFHVPEAARWHNAPGGFDSCSMDGCNGAFRLPSPEPGWMLAIIASDGEGWEHVSVHCYRKDGVKQRTPTWGEMAFVKRSFWDANDVAVQFYPREDDYVNCHPYTLHWWRPVDIEMPTPSSELVGPK